MALQEIRETIEIPELVLDGNGFGIVQKKINLKPNQLHNVFQMDIFQDAIPSTDDAPEVMIEWFVSPYPIIYSNMNFTPQFVNRGAMAGADTVLFKATCSNYTPQTFFDIEQFPNQSIGAQASFTFYTPTIYITGFVHGIDDALIRNIAFSFYIASITKKASLVTYGLGMIRERSVAQGINLMQQGRTIPPAANVGQVFPMWKYGGMRPERMLKGDGLRNFFLNQASDQSEAMLSTDEIRNFVAGARTMAGFDEAFGVDDAVVGPIPEWIRFGLNRGLVSGPIRSQFPPRKLYDNGNTVML
jgi:hypothetical protein